MSANWLVQTFFEAGSPGALWTQWAAVITACLLCVLLALEAPTAIAWARAERRSAGLLAGILGLGTALRLALPTAPMDIYSRLDPALVPAERAESVYGLAFPALVRALWSVTGPSDPAVFAANTVVGVLTIAAVHALALRLSDDRPAAALAALAVAVSPILSHYSRTDIQTVLEVGLTAWGLVALLRNGHWTDPVRAGLALGLAAVLRPEAGVVLPVALAGAWAARRRPRRTDVGLLAGLPILVPGALATLGLALGGVQTQAFSSPHAFLQGPLHPLFLDPTWTPIWVTAGLFLLPFASRPSARVRWWVAGSLVLLTWLVWGFSPEHMKWAGMRHQIRAVPFLALAAGFGLSGVAERAVARGSATLAAAALGLVALTAPAWVRVHQPATAHLEYRFFAEQLTDAVPAGCFVLTHLNPQGRDAALAAPIRLSSQRGLDHRWVNLDRSPMPREGCAVYYRGSACWARPAGKQPGQTALHRRCAATESVLMPVPLATTTLPGRSHGTDFYAEDAALEVGFFAIPDRTDQPPAAPGPSEAVVPPSQRLPQQVATARPPTRLEAVAPEPPEPPNGPVPALPADWPSNAIESALRADPRCPVEAVSCEGGVCIVATTAATCSRSGCAEAAEDRFEAVGATRASWTTGDGTGAVACALLPEDDPDAAHLVHATARAQGLLFELLNGS